MKTHFCLKNSCSILYDGVNRPKFCPICGAAQNVTATIQAPVSPRYQQYEEDSVDVESLANAISLGGDTSNKVKLKDVFGKGGDSLGDFQRPAMGEKEFEAYKTRMHETTRHEITG